MERKCSLLFASLKDWRTGGPFMCLVIHFCLRFIRQNQGWVLTLGIALHPLPCLKICMRWNSLAIYNSTWWQEELNWRIMRVFFSIIAVKFFSCSRFLVLNSLVHTPTPPSGPQPTVLLSLPRMEHDTSAFLFTFMLACGMLCCWFSPTATDTLSTCSLEHPHGSSSHAWTLKISMS